MYTRRTAALRAGFPLLLLDAILLRCQATEAVRGEAERAVCLTAAAELFSSGRGS